MKFILLLLSFFLSISISRGQEQTNLLANKKGEVGLYVSPFALLDYNATIYIGTEYFLKDKVSIYTDLGYMPHIQNIHRQKNKEDNRTTSAFLNSGSANIIIKLDIALGIRFGGKVRRK